MTSLERWQLRQGETVLGEIEVTTIDFPWLDGQWIPTNAFDAVRELFDAEVALVDEAGEEWELAYRRIAGTGS